MSKSFISTEKTIKEFETEPGFKEEFHSLFMYALYVSSGDFTSFDDPDKLMKAIQETEDKFKMFEL